MSSQEHVQESTGDRYASNFNQILTASEVSGVSKSDLLGYVFWFTLRKGCTLQELELSAKKHNLLEQFLPKAPTFQASFRYAVQHAHVGFKDIKTELITADKAKMIASVLERNEDSNALRIDYKQRSRVALLMYDKQGQELVKPKIALENAQDEVAQRIKELFDWHQNTLTSDDLRPMVTDVAHFCMCSILRQAGGMYFIPAEFSEQVERLVRVLDDVSSTGFLLPIIKSEATKETIFQAAQEGLFGEVAAIQNELYRIEEDMLNNKKVRENTVVRRIEAISELRSKWNMYSRLLERESEDLDNMLSDLMYKAAKIQKEV